MEPTENAVFYCNTPLIRRVLVRMIGFISSWVTHSHLITLKARTYSAIADLRTLQFTVARALGFFVFTSVFPATDLYTETTHIRYQLVTSHNCQSQS
jgi:hypothetical protein